MEALPELKHESDFHAQQNPRYKAFDGSKEVRRAVCPSEMVHMAGEGYRKMYQEAPEHYPEMKNHNEMPGSFGIHCVTVPWKDEDERTWNSTHVSSHSSLKYKKAKGKKAKGKIPTTGPTSSAIGVSNNVNSSTSRITLQEDFRRTLENPQGNLPEHKYGYQCAEVGLFSNHYYHSFENSSAKQFSPDQFSPGQFYVVGPACPPGREMEKEKIDRSQSAYFPPCGKGNQYGCSGIVEKVGAEDIGNVPENDASSANGEAEPEYKIYDKLRSSGYKPVHDAWS